MVTVTDHSGRCLQVPATKLDDVMKAVAEQWGIQKSRQRILNVCNESEVKLGEKLNGDETLLVETMSLEFGELLASTKLASTKGYFLPAKTNGTTAIITNESTAACLRVGEFTSSDCTGLCDFKLLIDTTYPLLRIRFVIHSELSGNEKKLDLLVNVSGTYSDKEHAVIRYDPTYSSLKDQTMQAMRPWNVRGPTIATLKRGAFRRNHSLHHVPG